MKDYIWNLIHKNYETYKVYHEDLFQCGALGIVKALAEHEYDPMQAAPTTFFQPYIAHELYQYTAVFVHRKTSHTMRVTMEIMETVSMLRQMGIKPTEESIAFYSGITQQTVHKYLKENAKTVVSMEALEEGESDLEDTGIMPEDLIFQKELTVKVRNAVFRSDVLSKPEQYALVLTYGLGGETKTAAEIGEDLNCKKGDVHQFVRSAKRVVFQVLCKPLFWYEIILLSEWRFYYAQT